MDQCSNNMVLVHLLLGMLAAVNVSLATWLAHKRFMADRRERKRNGNGLPRLDSVAASVEPSESPGSVSEYSPKD